MLKPLLHRVPRFLPIFGRATRMNHPPNGDQTGVTGTNDAQESIDEGRVTAFLEPPMGWDRGIDAGFVGRRDRFRC